MNTSKLLLIVITVVLTSCYFFPFVLEALPIANSKMILALLGLIMFGINLAKKGNAGTNFDFVQLSAWALVISLIAYASITINNTPDATFVSYIISMWVWLGGAYSIIMFIKQIHGKTTVPLVVNYLLAVCVLQCILALIFNNFTAAEEWHSSTFGGEAYMGNTDEDRLHGIGCALDVAGFRFAAVISMTAFLLSNNEIKKSKWTDDLYLASICFISIIGNIISRSTIVGTIIALVVIIYMSVFVRLDIKLIKKLSAVIIGAIVICTYLYAINPVFRSNFRFGFEGFFSLAEKGEWQTHSNDILKKMIVWPDNIKTWIIGDGYLNNPADKSLGTYDPYFVGKFHGYYMGTDIGYLRYIFYFGLIGLITFSIFFIKICRIVCRKLTAFKWMFIIVLAVNFIQWFKVSTDLFVVFAPFLCLSFQEDEDTIITNEN